MIRRNPAVLAAMLSLLPAPALFAQDQAAQADANFVPVSVVAEVLAAKTGREARDLVVTPLAGTEVAVRGLLSHERWPVYVPFYAMLERSENGGDLLVRTIGQD